MSDNIDQSADQPTGRVEETPINRAFAESLRTLPGLANAQTVPSGILLDSPFTYESFTHLNGEDASDEITQRSWEQHYHDLRRGVISGASAAAGLPPLDAVKDSARKLTAQGVTPIVVADLRYHARSRQFEDEIAEASKAGRAIAIPEEPGSALEERRGFIASAVLPDVFDNFRLLPHEHAGLDVHFVLERSSYISNHLPEPPRIEMDFDDGNGFRPVAFDEVIAVSYADEAEKHVQIAATFPDRVLRAVFTFRVSPKVTIGFDFSWHIEARIPYKGKTAGGPAWVILGSENGVRHTAIVRPVMLADGFPGHTFQEILKLLNKQQFLNTILAAGYDVVVLSYDDGTDYIQRNAFVAVACIEAIIENRVGSEKLVVGGASMGGVITRYALAYMEQHAMDHQARMFVSFDSPQQGAGVPPADQWFIAALAAADASPDATKLHKQLISSAARQLLYYSIPSYDYKGSLTDKLHTELYGELGKMGYPRKTRNVAVADGSGNGKQIIPNGAHTMHWYGNLFANGDTWALPNGSGKIGEIYLATLDFFKRFTYSVNGVVNYDGAPGGLLDANGQLAAAIQASKTGSVDHWYDNNCFVPTVSALDIRASNVYEVVPPQGAPTRFNTYFVSRENNEHVDITLPIKAYLLKEITGRYQPLPMQMIISNSFRQVLGAASNGAETDGPTSPLFGGFQMNVPPAMTAVGKTLYLVLTGIRGQIYTSTSKDGINWAPPVGPILGGFQTDAAPALATLGNRAYLALVGKDKHLYVYHSTDGVQWSDSGRNPKLGPWQLQIAPALAALNETLYLVWPGLNRKVYVTTSKNGEIWTTPNGPLIGGFELPASPALAVMRNTLYLALPGMDQRLHSFHSADGANWKPLGSSVIFPSEKLRITPGWAAASDRLYLAWPGLDGTLRVASSADGIDWGQWPRTGIFNNWKIPFAPAVAGFAAAADTLSGTESEELGLRAEQVAALA